VITLRRLNGKDMILNSELIETIEAGPDTVITLVTGNRYVVKDTSAEVVSKVLEFKRKICADTGRIPLDWEKYKKSQGP